MPDDAMLSLDLGAEELLFLLYVLRIKTLAGLGENPVAGLTEDQVNRALAAGFNALRARGWVRLEGPPEEYRIILDTALAALIGTCASALRLLYISRLPVDGPWETLYVHCGPALMVLHQQASPGVHRFQATAQLHIMLEALATNLHLDHQPAFRVQEIRVSEPVFDRAAAAVRANQPEMAEALLVEAGVSEDAAHLIPSILGTLRANTLVTRLQIKEPAQDSGSAGFSLLESAIGLWVVQVSQPEGAPPEITIVPIGAEACRKKLEEMLGAGGREPHG